ncbi:hypothetical protein BS47DRAFT_1329438 [Hydnum rufescens UP504]|uniref:Uncharacterized protein n=1 Tax=Hydnum rufescens UP504 TaxID=1448309 RepID=A0A9P6DST5_9AGAM|nr:hypothetical protein BS47DRAFT_1329438 [Hydnum rufescens UP504]
MRRSERLSFPNGSPATMATPTTGRLNRTPASTRQSISANVPFDWDAARNNLTPPYGTPTRAGGPARRPRPSTVGVGGGVDGIASPAKKKRIVRKASWYEWATSFYHNIVFEISLFPYNVPLPHPTTSGRAIGGVLHVTHMMVKWYGRSHALGNDNHPDDIWKSEVDWHLADDEVAPGSIWTSVVIAFLLAFSIVNALYLFTRIRSYHLHYRNELVNSTHASLISKDILDPPPPPTISQRALKLVAQSFRTAWRLVFGTSPRPEDLIPIDLQPGSNKVQQLDLWNPGDLETALFMHVSFLIYSPAHFLAWKIFSAENWFYSFFSMGLISLQMYTLVFAYTALIKDKAILSAEVLHEYDAKFVTPRLHPIKKDKSVMTHEAVMVDDWRRY